MRRKTYRQKKPPDPPEGRLLAIDPEAQSAEHGLPAFLSRPAGAPVYHGFPVLDDVEAEGFRFGMITNFEAEPEGSWGDAFIVAPDGSRAGIVWNVADDDRFKQAYAMTKDR